MPKEFYTEKDIEDLWKRGSHVAGAQRCVVLTELAYEKANRLGMKLVQPTADNPPSAPVRPYLSPAKPAAVPSMADVAAYLPAGAKSGRRHRQATWTCSSASKMR